MLRSGLCDYSDAYILVKGTITLATTVAQGQSSNGANKKVIFKNCSPFTSCISRIKNTHSVVILGGDQEKNCNLACLVPKEVQFYVL